MRRVTRDDVLIIGASSIRDAAGDRGPGSLPGVASVGLYLWPGRLHRRRLQRGV